ncbi:uncharacterized protein LOC106160740 [Lingula anatina]|uniref:Uncharacterized protein LOC106160740 n=1 Tax=Lingula anatina TaxID=7574 RepID=A0A1S3I666_LINAN|nr:uncharacterized protein LOC106160740 [Lingula anatina]|eukprot:XP_013392864.1 uncharacterized protein LOC106160740 [Lingula anatina]
MLTLILVSVFVTVIQLSTTSPLPSSDLRWNMPCARGGKKADNVPKAVTISNETLANLEEALNVFLDHTIQISNQAHSIKKRWLNNRYHDNVEIFNFVLKSVKSPTSLPSLIYYENGRPVVNESGICNGSCITFLRNVSESLRKETMHLEIIREHEHAEYLTHKQTADITDTHLLENLENLMYDIVCEINEFINETEDGLVKFYQTETPSGWKSYPNKSERYARDLVLIHHVHSLVNSVKDSFSHVMAERFRSLGNPGSLN